MQEVQDKMELKPVYKKSRQGGIPGEWELLKFSAIADIIMGQSPLGASYNKDQIGIPLLNGPTEFTDRYPQKIQWTSQPTKLSKIGDILLCVRGSSTGRINISHEKFCIGRGVAVIRARTGTDKDFLEYQLKSAISRILKLATGSTFPNVDSKTLKSISVTLPPLLEQRAIARILSVWDEGIATLQTLILQKQARKKGLMQLLLTGKKRFEGCDGEWKKMNLGDLGTFSRGKGVAKKDLVDIGYPAIRYGELYTIHHIEIKFFNSYISQESAGQGIKVIRNDILFAGSGEKLEDIGKSAAYLGDDQPCAGGDIVIFSPKKNLDALFLSLVLNSQNIRKQLLTLGQGHSVVHIYPSGLRSLRLQIPPFPEQQKIASVISAASAEIAVLKQQLTALREQKKGMMQKLLMGEVRVKNLENYESKAL